MIKQSPGRRVLINDLINTRSQKKLSTPSEETVLKITMLVFSFGALALILYLIYLYRSGVI